MSKKFSDCVRPGVEDVRARPRTDSRELIKLDLPTLERPKNAISGLASRGQSASLKALLRNSALRTFIRSSRRPSAYLSVLCVESTFYRRERRDTQRAAERSINRRRRLRPGLSHAPGKPQLASACES